MMTLALLVTTEFRRFAEFAMPAGVSLHIGLCYGPPGVGKTLSGAPLHGLGSI